MRTYLDCIPCFFKQALEAARLSGADEREQKKILDRVARIVPKFPLKSSPPEMARSIHRIVKNVSGVGDPYHKIKVKSNKLALNVYPRLKRIVQRSKNSLFTAVELAIAGNIIDYGVKNSVNVKQELARILSFETTTIKKEGSSVFNFKAFKRSLRSAKIILYLADNAGEVVFDRILIEEIVKENQDADILYAVKSYPIINDALFADAKFAGIDRYARIISSGLDSPGTVLSLCSKTFLKIFNNADMIISKGQGNFEALSDAGREIFYLFMVKCPVVVKDVGCKLGDIVLMRKKI